MAVYTHLSNAQISAYIAPFNIGGVVDFKGISGGIENTNYLSLRRLKASLNSILC